jgi:hypothetical protein
VLLLAASGAIVAGDAKKPESPVSSSSSSASISTAETRLKEDVSFLAADAQEGRGPGTKGIEVSADYIADSFRRSGLKPAPGLDGYFQPFHITGNVQIAGTPELEFKGSKSPSSSEGTTTIQGEYKKSFNPLAIGTGTGLSSVPLAFAGYGITAKNEALKLDYDDYQDIDVTGKVVLLIRNEPQRNDEKSPFEGKKTTNYATFQHKATNAYQHGAAGVLLVNDAETAQGNDDRLIGFYTAGTEPISKLPFTVISRELAEKLLAAAGQPKLTELEKTIDEKLTPVSRLLGSWTVTEKTKIDRLSIDTKNVIGVIEGVGPHADETVVIGGHYDHLGRGGPMSGSNAPKSEDIHNGADDNASGTSMVLELARRIGARKDAPPRRVVFMAFSGEERGLLGSKHYVEHPVFPLSTTVMMINCDMVGRLGAKQELTMIGTGTADGLEPLVEVLGKTAGFTIKKVSGMTDGFGGSDHQSFYGKQIPVLFAFTGLHKDYHRPSDDAQLINYAGMARIADYLELIALDVIRRPERPVLTKPTPVARTKKVSDPARATGFSVYLGTRPDYAAEGIEGVKLEGVSDGSPAEKAGLKGGDIVIKFGGKKVGTLNDYMESMSRYKPGDVVEVVVRRDNKDVTLKVTLGSRSSD